MPSSCEMFVYNYVMSAVTKRVIYGKADSLSIRFRKCFVSLMYDGRFLDRSWMKWVM